MKTIDKHEGLRTPFGIVSTEDLMLMMNPIRERDNKIAELDAEVKRLREHIRIMRYWVEPIMLENHQDVWRILHEEICEGGD